MSIVRSGSRILDMVECFANESSEWGIVELSERLGYPISTTHRLLNTLVEKEYIHQDKKQKKYKIGNKLLWLAGSVMGKCSLRTVSRNELIDISNITEETVHLCGFVGFDIYYLDKVEGTKSINTRSTLGLRQPAYATSVGKAILANMDENKLSSYFENIKFESFTKNTITNKDNLKKHLEKIKEQGYAIDNEELEEGLTCVAAPIFNAYGEITGAISISGPTFRIKEKMDSYISLIKEKSNLISNKLGYRNYKEF